MGAVTDSRYDAVLLAGFGGPEGPDDVMPFLRNVTRGRGVPDERLAEVAEHYLALGGVSPINGQNRALREHLAAALRSRGVDLPVLWGNRNWSPYLADALREADGAGRRALLAVATSAYSSYSSCRQYREDFAAALVDTGLLGTLRIDKLRPYYDHPGFLRPFAEGLAAALSAATADGLRPDLVHVVFTTHSIPLAMADASGTGEDGRLYVRQHLAACVEVARLAGLADDGENAGAGPAWQLAYQSRSGSPQIPWLEPDIGDVIVDLAAAGARGVIVVPIGFISDHVEVIWDLDTEAAAVAAEHGLWFRRVATPGVHPEFVGALADLVVERLAGAADRVASTTSLPARPDCCPAGCCRPRTIRPTTGGADSAADWADTGTAPAQLVASGIAGVGPA
jgi:ferrochelatase